MKTRTLTCKPGDIVIHAGKKVWVSQIADAGKEDRTTPKGKFISGIRDCISACRILDDNGQILKRSPKYIDSNWQHL